MKDERVRYFLNIAVSVAQASTCTRKKFGALLVKNGDIISTGYNGSVRGAKNCGTEQECLKDLWDEEHYLSYIHCPAIHAEHNAVLNAGRPLALGSTMFLSKGSGDGMSGPPCQGCRRVIIQSGVKDIYYLDYDGVLVHEMVEFWIEVENDWMRAQEDLSKKGNSLGDMIE